MAKVSEEQKHKNGMVDIGGIDKRAVIVSDQRLLIPFSWSSPAHTDHFIRDIDPFSAGITKEVLLLLLLLHHHRYHCYYYLVITHFYF